MTPDQINELALKCWSEVSKSTSVGQSIATRFAQALITEYEKTVSGEALKVAVHECEIGQSEPLSPKNLAYKIREMAKGETKCY